MKPDMKARLSLLHKTETEWNKLSTLVPYAGEVIIFEPDQVYPYARLKIGDGKTLLKDLPFFIDSSIDRYITKKRFDEIIDAGRVTDYKN